MCENQEEEITGVRVEVGYHCQSSGPQCFMSFPHAKCTQLFLSYTDTLFHNCIISKSRILCLNQVPVWLSVSFPQLVNQPGGGLILIYVRSWGLAMDQKEGTQCFYFKAPPNIFVCEIENVCLDLRTRGTSFKLSKL